MSYTIQSGDTLSSIAAKNGTDAATLAKLNNISNPNMIQAGSSLSLPGQLSSQASYTAAPVSSGSLNPATGLAISPTGQFGAVNGSVGNNPIYSTISPSGGASTNFKAPTPPVTPAVQPSSSYALKSSTQTAPPATSYPQAPTVSQATPNMTPAQQLAAGGIFDVNTGKLLSTEVYGNGGSTPQSTSPTPTTSPTDTSGSSPTNPYTANPYNANDSIQQSINNYLQQIGGYTQQQNSTQAQLDAITAKNATFSADAGLGIANVQDQPIATPFISGQSAAIQRQADAQIAANNSTAIPIQTQLARIQAQKQAAMDAGKLLIGAQTPQPLPYTSQLVNPLTGQSTSGGTGNPITSQIPSLAQQVASGRMSYAEAASTLGNNPAFLTQLNQAVQGINPNFNTNASNNLSTPQYQTLLNSFNTTTQHLQDLSDSISKLPLTSIPLINSAINGVSGALGSQQYQDYKTKLGVARAEVANVLGGGQATDQSRNEATSILPDNLGPQQLGAAITAAKQLMQQKIQSYGSLGGGSITAQGNQGTTSMSNYSPNQLYSF